MIKLLAQLVTEIIVVFPSICHKITGKTSIKKILDFKKY